MRVFGTVNLLNFLKTIMSTLTKKISGFILLSITLFGCNGEQAEPLRIGLNTWPAYEFLYLAEQKGFFKDENLDIKLVEFSSLSDARRSYERGQIDGLGTSLVDVFQAREQSPRSLQVVQVIDYSDGADMILSNAKIKNGQELRGKKIGFELASLGIYVLARGLDKFGLTLADVQITGLDQISLAEALSNGTLDAIVTYPPTSIDLQRDTNANTLFSSSEIPGEVVDVMAIDDEIIQQRPEEVKKLLRAYYRAIAYTQQNPDESYAIMAEREGITPQEFAQSFDGIRLVSQAQQTDFFKQGGKLEKVVEKVDKILRESGQIKGADHRTDTITNRFSD
jgi:NitT/TauT family transport system substrate-binding protein